jgi:hypothetical protein
LQWLPFFCIEPSLIYRPFGMNYSVVLQAWVKNKIYPFLNRLPGNTTLTFMSINAIIFGSTGMIGKGLLLECLDNTDVKSVLIVNGGPGEVRHLKLKEVILMNFRDLSPLDAELANYNTCYFCLGVSATGLSEEEYRKITFDLTVSVANDLLKINKDMTFCYISGAGTDSTEKGKMMWARVKGRTENTLLAMPFKQVFILRPG